ncbi:EthD domain-containing protein [Pseudomonas sp. NFX224]|uniref:EthD domain-containing protein n=1 Tax=Pseudomonas sp. NFX224 TaxID=3402862 RepID=UPI003AFB64AA
MFTVIYIFKRKPEITRDHFLEAYEEHRQVMIESARGLISYTQNPTTAPQSVGGIVSNTGNSEFDAVSIYTYRNQEDAEFTSGLVAVEIDSARFIDFTTIITLTVTPVIVR